VGACFDELDLDGKLTESQLEKRFKAYQDECDHESGQSYSGRLNMCRGLEIKHSKEFNSHHEASEYLSETCQKWENAIAVRYKETNRFEPDAKLTKLLATSTELQNKLNALERDLSTAIDQKLKSIEFVSCPTCRSRLDTRFRTKTLKCPVCDGSFVSKTDAKKRDALRAKLKDVQTKITEHRDALQTKANKKQRETRWLIGGLCSS
jgi:hypothetical protein